MKIQTRAFGEVDIDDQKIIEFPEGIVGFPDLNHFTLIFDDEKGRDSIQWLQSIEEPGFAMPVMNPLIVLPDYNPAVDDEYLQPIGGIAEDGMLVLVTVTVPVDIERLTVNLRGPIVINTETRKGMQVILDDEKFEVKFPIYKILKENKDKKEKEGE